MPHPNDLLQNSNHTHPYPEQVSGIAFAAAFAPADISEQTAALELEAQV